MASRSVFLELRRNVRSYFLRAAECKRNQSLSSVPSDFDSVEESPPVADDLKSRIFRLRFPKRSATGVLQRWIGEGKEVSLPELRHIGKELMKSQRYKHALEISEWMVTHQEFEASDHDYAVRIDLTAKVFGTNAAEEFFNGLSSTMKTCETYSALLHSFAAAKQTEKAEELFEEMKQSILNLSALPYNEMMTLYMSIGQQNKISPVVEELKRQKVMPDLFTYNLWVSACAAALDITGVRRILDEMTLQGSSSNDSWKTYVALTDIYITATHLINSNSSPVEAEKKITQREWITYDFLVILYASMPNKEKVTQIWKSLRMTSQKMTSRNYICILSSYIMLGEVKEAEEVIDLWRKSVSDFDVSACKRLFYAFSEAGFVEKAECFRELLVLKEISFVDWHHQGENTRGFQ